MPTQKVKYLYLLIGLKLLRTYNFENDIATNRLSLKMGIPLFKLLVILILIVFKS
jgi:hypothetical protein